MDSKLVRYQIVAFVVVTVLGVTYAMFNYVGLAKTLGFGQYTVSVDLPSAGGLYANADVTERGVTVGKVKDLHLTHGGGVVADIDLDNGTQIPSKGLKAAVANTSAVGEQYLNLTPDATGGPYLTAGSTVPKSEVSLPPTPNTVLANLNSLLESVPKAQLNTTINQLYDAFNGSGPQLKQLLDSATQLLASAQQSEGQTQSLINESEPVLQTQADTSADIENFSQNLAAFTTQLKDSNADLKGTIDQAPATVTQLNDLVGQIQPTVPLLLANLTSVSQVTDAYIPNLKQVLVILPADINDLTDTIDSSPISGTDNVNFKVEADNPCTAGYEQDMRSPSDTSYAAAPNPTPTCAASKSAQVDARGAREDPCPNDPSIRSATAAGCGLYFGDTAEGGSDGSSSGDSATTYDPTNGLFVGPNDILYSLGSDSVNGNGPTSLNGLLKQTLGS
jgi:phospholipid/cholesterol/gamma-HCH transport system substrate-binding protein